MKLSKPVSSVKSAKRQKPPSLRPGPGPKKSLGLDCAHTPVNPKYGQEVVYTISYTNPGNAGVTSVKIEYDQSSGIFPSDIDLIAATNGGTVQGTSKIVWNSLGSLGAGESGMVSFTLRMPMGMDPFGSIQISSSVSIRSDQTLQKTMEHMTEVLPWSGLTWTVSCPDTVTRGQTFPYIISIFNTCTTMVTALRGHATFSPDVTLIGFESPTGDSILIDLLGGLSPGQSMTIIAKVKVHTNAPVGTDVICMNCSFLSDESAGVGSGVCCSCN